ncbi:MAG: short-chain fatty acyl-CoA regulator family protein [Pseudomonadota bacterium]
MTKTLVGPQLRQLRRSYNQTQAEMARNLNVSASYVNLLENNQRSLSVKVLLALTEAYGVDWRELVNDSGATQLADLRVAVRDPALAADRPDLQELRAALDHAPRLVGQFLELHQNHRAMLGNLQHFSTPGAKPDVLVTSPETAIHDFFRQNSNHFAGLEAAAEVAREAIGGKRDDIYTNLKMYLYDAYGIDVALKSVEDMPDTLRVFDRRRNRVALSEVLDPINRNFQLAHVLALVNCADQLDDLISTLGMLSDAGRARCRVELANYFAAALLMPYAPFLKLAEASEYDVDRLAAKFGVTFEMACQRLTTMQRKGAQGVPFFFLRIDRAGNVTKRFNATPFTLAEQGGSCPVWNIHTAFAAPGMIVPQFVELPDSGQFFTISRTTDRPVMNRYNMDRRLVVALGCERTHVKRVGYASPFNLADETSIAKIGINCHICPRQACAQRAHEPLHVNLPVDANRRGSTRYES